jgi:hypothetical protein
VVVFGFLLSFVRVAFAQAWARVADRAGSGKAQRFRAPIKLGACAACPLARRFVRPMPGPLRRSADASLPIAQSSAGRTGEEPMTITTTTILLINSLARLLTAIAQLIAVLRWRRGP